jgi:hypothetical protein
LLSELLNEKGFIASGAEAGGFHSVFALARVIEQVEGISRNTEIFGSVILAYAAFAYRSFLPRFNLDAIAVQDVPKDLVTFRAIHAWQIGRHHCRP